MLSIHLPCPSLPPAVKFLTALKQNVLDWTLGHSCASSSLNRAHLRCNSISSDSSVVSSKADQSASYLQQILQSMTARKAYPQSPLNLCAHS